MAFIAVTALFIDLVIGWPAWLFARIGHPVTWLGRLIATLDDRMNHGPDRRKRGMIASLLVIAAAMVPAAILQMLLGPWAAAVLAWPLVAARSLDDHLRAVATPLRMGDLPAARRAVAMIVGRDVSNADEPAIARASLESLAENASDGVVAPLFWAVVLGLPGIAAYKAINTLDSMIGHRTPKHEEFGNFAARLDDFVNIIPARLTAVLIAVAGISKRAVECALADGPKHRSPNAGWPEGAMAGALGVRLSGPRVYGSHISQEPWLNGTAPDPHAKDLQRGITLYRRAITIGGLLLVVIAI
ncbi:adenosylcobinamide-phosphate synthase CbiB [Paracoccus sp. JM45]|uniref:adenosylcobinamide-phosphate synthase CbiB n=1 Tax=Paracoccus sp. JM45 TaxID=2283626 RepID=UPI000E6BA22D|nr:adenosylcobinamide-phosphate synthase CbiB [Paracoccus sp. JM45]RJE79756.1 cobalamin biosynthesis protein CobD [Paracoccus sp. JM45]